MAGAGQSRPDEILIVDEAPEAERLTATLRVLFGYQHPIRYAASIGDALDGIAETTPSFTFLGDRPSIDGEHAMAMLRRAGYGGPIIVVSSAVTPSCRARLIAAGASDVIHKDDLYSARVTEAFDRTRVPKPTKMKG
jgi:CheY-like chemotaxis protein